jgi:predicted acylesterase/phospholipase RssA
MSRLQARYLATTLMLAAIGVGFVMLQGRLQPPAPRLERRLDPAARPPVPPAAPPSAREVLDRRAALALAPEQVMQLEALDRRWGEESRELTAAVARAQEEFTRFMGAQAGRASLPEIQRQSASFRELSAELREQRRRHADAAAGLLTESQRAMLRTTPAPPVTGEGR